MSSNFRRRAAAASLISLGLLVTAGEAANKKKPVPVAPPPRVTVAAPEKVTSVEGITEYRLANGLRVLLFPDLRSRPSP